MALDPDRLLGYPIPEVRHRFTKRDTILYALSVGLGQDPMDARQLDFVDHHRALRALPSMAVVLGQPGSGRDLNGGCEAPSLSRYGE